MCVILLGKKEKKGKMCKKAIRQGNGIMWMLATWFIWIDTHLQKHYDVNWIYPQRDQLYFSSGKITGQRRDRSSWIKPEPNAIRWPKSFNRTKCYKYHRVWGHDTENYETLKNKLGRMFRLRQLPLPKSVKKPNNDKNPLRDNESIFINSGD